MMYGVMDKTLGKVVFTYFSEVQKTFTEYTSDNFIQFEMLESNGVYWADPKAYNYINDIVMYNDTYTPTTSTYIIQKREELVKIKNLFNDFMLQAACENSLLLNTEIGRLASLGQINPYDPNQIATFVRSKLDPFVDALEPLVADFEKYYFWRLDEHLDNIPREPVLANEERIAAKKIELKKIVELQ